MDEIKTNDMVNTETESATTEMPVQTEDKQVRKEPYKRVFVGKVKSNKSDKTIVVTVERQRAHPLYKKYYKTTRSFMAHDENNDCNIGDTVKIKECRRLSAKKRWELVEVVERAK